MDNLSRRNVESLFRFSLSLYDYIVFNKSHPRSYAQIFRPIQIVKKVEQVNEEVSA